MRPVHKLCTMLCMEQAATMLTVGERLRVARERAGLSVNEMAVRLSRHRNMVSRWEKGHAEPPLWVVRTYGEATQATIEWLVAEVGPPPSWDRESGWIPGLLDGWLATLDGRSGQLTLFGGADVHDLAARRLDAIVYADPRHDRRRRNVPVACDRRRVPLAA